MALLARAVADDDDPCRIVGVLLHAGGVERDGIGWIHEGLLLFVLFGFNGGMPPSLQWREARLPMQKWQSGVGTSGHGASSPADGPNEYILAVLDW